MCVSAKVSFHTNMAISHEAPNGVKFFTSFLVMHRLLKVLRSDQIIYRAEHLVNYHIKAALNILRQSVRGRRRGVKEAINGKVASHCFSTG